MLFHRHKFGKVQEDGFQYCEKCGKAVLPAPPECQHIWQRVNLITVSGVFGVECYKYILVCKKCGGMTTHSVGT